jgi:uncharacterized membrane protein YhaH (DUF805 family)
MNLTQTLFSFGGRIRRSTYWLHAIGVAVVAGIVIVVGVTLSAMGNGGVLTYLGLAVSFAGYIAAIWASLALYIKRLHDKDLMWAWIFCPVYPAIVAMFLDGTQGPNRFGPSPKGLTGPAVAAS